MTTFRCKGLRTYVCILALLTVSWTGLAHAQFDTRPTPLWEGYTKTADDIENDQDLITKSIEAAGSKERALDFALRLAWSEIGKGDPNQAIRRFNQAWLIEPNEKTIYWGFGIATHIRGDELPIVQKWFAKAEEKLGKNARLSADQGRVLGERGMPEKAKRKFEEALAQDPTYEPALIGMIQVAKELGDHALQSKHESLHKELTSKTE